jgi:hypothetical protein
MEQQIAGRLAKLRYLNNREKGTVNQRVGGQSDEVTDLEGIAGEIAFTKLANIYPDFQVKKIKDVDCIYKGWGVDVKTTSYKNGRLLATMKKANNKAEVYVLMVGEMPIYEFKGWLFADELFRRENIINLGHGLTYGVSQHRLRLNVAMLRNGRR